jgi:hypothetical protein
MSTTGNGAFIDLLGSRIQSTSGGRHIIRPISNKTVGQTRHTPSAIRELWV